MYTRLVVKGLLNLSAVLVSAQGQSSGSCSTTRAGMVDTSNAIFLVPFSALRENYDLPGVLEGKMSSRFLRVDQLNLNGDLNLFSLGTG